MAAEQLLGFDIEDDSSEVQFSIHAANLGDGYVRRKESGINNTRQIFNISWSVLLDADAQTLIGSINANKGVTSFAFTPPGESTARNFVITSYNVQRVGPTFRRVSAQLTESFN